MRVATDIGGTFTDLVYLDEASGKLGVAKASTTPTNFAEGVIETLGKATLSVPETKFFAHGSTIIVNALTERKGVKTGLITTKGFRDVLEIGRANRPDIYNMYYTKPKPFVPRHLRFEVEERVNYKGEALVSLNETDVQQAVEKFKAEGVQAIAVCFLHSYANPAHEIECGELINQLTPDLPVTLSHQITKEWREYERTNTTVLKSYVHPIVRAYLDNLEGHLTTMGMSRQSLHVMQSNGGSATQSDPRATSRATTVSHSILRCVRMLSRTLRTLDSCSKCSRNECSSAIARVARNLVCSRNACANSLGSSSAFQLGATNRAHSCLYSARLSARLSSSLAAAGVPRDRSKND